MRFPPQLQTTSLSTIGGIDMGYLNTVQHFKIVVSNHDISIHNVLITADLCGGNIVDKNRNNYLSNSLVLAGPKSTWLLGQEI